MVKVPLEYVGAHQEKGVFDIDEKKKQQLLSTGAWKEPGVKMQKGNKEKAAKILKEKPTNGLRE